MPNRKVASGIPQLCLSLGLVTSVCALQVSVPIGALANVNDTYVMKVAPGHLSGSTPPAVVVPAPTATVAPAATAPSAPAAEAQASASASPEAVTPVPPSTVFADVQQLVEKSYPKAKITVSDTALHFEYNCKNEIGYYSGRPVLAPQNGGILGDISVVNGQYGGKNKNRLPSEVQDGFHTNLTMAPYSPAQGKYLLVHLSYPTDMQPVFKTRFEAAVNNFDKQELAAEAAAAKAAKAAAVEKAAADKAAAQEAAEQAAKDAAASQEAAFGAPTMSEHRFPDGKFKIWLPDEFQSSHTIQMGMAKVDYFCPTPQGELSVSYIQMADTFDTNTATTQSQNQDIRVQDISLGFAKVLTYAGGADAKTLARMQQRATVLKLGAATNAAVLRELNADLQSIDSPFLHYQAGAVLRKAETALVKGGRADDTLTAANALFDKLSANLIQGINGTSSQQAFTTLQSQPGKEIVVNEIKGKPGVGAQMRIYLCGNYVYELSAVGEKTWLESPAVNQFLTSFRFWSQ